MKKTISFFLILVSMALTSCEKHGYVVDWSPVSLFVKVTDAHGADLLDPDNPDNLIDGATITFMGETYEASRYWYETGRPYEMPATKAYLARLYGLFLVNGNMFNNHSETAGFSLYFGQIDGAADMDEDLVVTFSNGISGTIHYHCSNHNERRLSCKRNWHFNGSKTEGNIFTFVVSD